MAKIALLIGVSEYEPGLNPLPAAVRDVEALQKVLLNPAIGGFAESDVVLLKNPDQSTMALAIETLFTGRSKDDLVLLFFSGHGIKDDAGRLFLTTRGTRKTLQGDLIRSTAVQFSFIQDSMSRSRSKRQVVILDSCFSGAFAEGLSAKDDGTLDIRSQLGGEGRAILTSSSSTQYSFEHEGSELSLYTRFLIEGIETGAADTDEDEVVSIDELHEYASRKVKEIKPELKPAIFAIREGFKIRLTKVPAIPDTLAKFAALEMKRDDDFFLKESIEIITIMPDSTEVYKFWQANLDCLNEDLLTILEQWAKKNLTSSRSKKARALANELIFFSDYIQQFPLGSIEINKELAIKGYQLALTVLTFKKFPQDWARIQNGLGIAYKNRIRGGWADNLEAAITCYQEALNVYTFAAFPQGWADTQICLGVAYSDRIRGERADNLETAIACYQEALKVYTFTAFPQQWAITQMNLGSAYRKRIRGERADNLETAITCYQEALKVYTFTAFPQQWAMTQNNLGIAYWARIREERADNLEKAIICCQEALKIRTFDAFPQDWALTQGNLAEALTARSSLNNNAQDLDQAIELYQQALTVSAPGSYHFINDQYGLGNALARRYETSKNPDDLQQSLAAYQIALNYLSPEHYNRQKYWQAIPATQAILGSRLVRDGNWQEGLKLLINSLNQLKTGDNSLVYANALYQTGYAYELLSDQENARLYYRDALRLYEHLQDLPGIATSRESLGNVFVSQGHLEKGMSELAQAREIYQQLGKTEAAEKVDNIYQSVQQVWEQVKSEVLV